MKLFCGALLFLGLSGFLVACVELPGALEMQGSVDSQSHTVRIRSDQRAQVMDGFGASDAWIIDPMIRNWSEQKNQKAINRLADLLFDDQNGVGLSMWRFNIGAGSAEQGAKSRIPDPLRRAELLISEPGGIVDHSKQMGQIAFAQAAAKRGVKDMIAFVNSPPTWATKNGLAHPGSSDDVSLIGSTNLDPANHLSFARFQADVVRYLRDVRGLPIKYLSPINEPTWHWTDQTQEGNRYNNREVRDVYLATHLALLDAGLKNVVEVDAGESVEYLAALSDQVVTEFSGKPYSAGVNGLGLGDYRDYVNLLLGDAELRQVVGNKISLHGYWSDALPERITDLRRLVKREVAETSPDARIWMSELCVLGPAAGVRPFDGQGFDINDMDYALHIARIIHHDLVDLEATAWMWWLAVTAYDYKDGLLKVDRALRAESLEASKLMWALGNFSRFIRPGFQRIETDFISRESPVGAASELLVSSYISSSGSDWVTVIVNLSEKSQVARIELESTPTKSVSPTANGDWDIYLTDEANNLTWVGRTKKSKVTLPARSVATLTRSERHEG
tara:strand:- start:4530 stop:6212 length:1683 start_codon:yes stop_codon:yes gene_type:complete